MPDLTSWCGVRSTEMEDLTRSNVTLPFRIMQENMQGFSLSDLAFYARKCKPAFASYSLS